MKANGTKMLSNRYKIIEQIGIGGMSYVYKARDTLKRKDVAIKILKEELVGDKDLVKRFKDEAIQSKKINHKNVVNVYDLVDEGDMHYIVMEYLDGLTLTNYIKKKGHLTNEETIKFSIEIAEGLKAAHKEGIIHRDIKPQNIVVKESGDCRITDFGIARAISSTTQNVSVVGTVHYISPEQASNNPIDFRSDIYSLGCTMYEMITGIVPFPGDAPVNIIVSHIRNSIKRPSLDNPEIYKSLEKIIMKATKIVPRERYQDADELINDLKLALNDKEGSFIKEDVYDDTEGKTIIITDDQMNFIKNVSLKYTNANTNCISEEEEKSHSEFNRQYIDKGILGTTSGKIMMAALGVLIVVIIFIGLGFLHLMKDRKNISTESFATHIRDNQIIGLDVEVANILLKDYGMVVTVDSEDFFDNVERGKIASIVADKTTSNNISVVLSKGPEVLDFTDIDKLNDTRFTEMVPLLEERHIPYSTVDSFDSHIDKGYIIGCNKKYSSDKGDLVFTISKGLGEDMQIMPDLYNKSIVDAKFLLESNNLVLGVVGKRPDPTVREFYIVEQSIPKGREVAIGTVIDVIESSGLNGENVAISGKGKFIGSLNTSYVVAHGNGGYLDKNGEKNIIIAVRLKQTTKEGIKYTELMQPKMYKEGTSISLSFDKIEGEIGLRGGDVQVVDCYNDEVLANYNVIFKEG